MNRANLLLILMLLLYCPMFGQTKSDSVAIKSTALDFIEGWYTGDVVRFEKSLHGDLVSKVVTSKAPSLSRIENFSAALLIKLTAKGGGKSIPYKEQKKEIVILDIYQNAAVVKILAYDAMEYLHMARWNGEWKIINILFERTKK